MQICQKQPICTGKSDWIEIPKDQSLQEKILEIRAEHKDFGYRRIWWLLRQTGLLINKKRVQRIVQKLSLQVTSYTRKSRKYNSYKGTVGKVAPNRLRRRFETSVAHQKIVTDMTEFKYYERYINGKVVLRKAYFDPFLDLYNREVISYNLGKAPTAAVIMFALEQAIKATADCKYRRTFHSDQDWGYQMKAYQKRLKEERIFQSMSQKATCLDNNVMENFFGLLKQEIYYGRTYTSFDELKRNIEQWIEYYNTKRIKQKLDWLSSVEYRLTNAA